MQGLVNTLRSLGPGRIIALGMVAAGLIGLFAYIISRFGSADMAPLFAGLEPSDSTAIVGALDSRGIAYELGNGGTSIMVPSSEVAKLRLELASEGLPGYGMIGYEIFDNLDALGTTSNIIEINQRRAIEGELARTIRWLDAVQNARVHLVLPQRTTFSRETQPPSASIILDIRGGRTLSVDQVVAIQNLVASAVNGMVPDEVSVIDQTGRLLSESTRNNGSDQLQNAYETEVEHRIVELLSAYVGAGHVQAKVTADMNFDLVTTSQTAYDPEGVVTAEATTVDRSRESSDQQNSEAVTVVTELPNPQGGEAGTTSFTRDNSTEERITNRVSVTETQRTVAPGAVERLSIAVMVDGSYDPTITTNADGEEVATVAYRARTQEELDALRALIVSAVGFNEARGDTIEVRNLQFADGMALAELAAGGGEAAVGGLLDGLGIDLMRMIELVVLAVLAIVAILFVVRPMMRSVSRAVSPPALAGAGAGGGTVALEGGQRRLLTDGSGGEDGEEGNEGAEGADGQLKKIAQKKSDMEEFIDLAKIEGQVRRSSINKVSEVIDAHPQEAVALLRSWLYADGR